MAKVRRRFNEATAMFNLKKAACLNGLVMDEFVIPRLQNIMDKSQVVSHSVLSNQTMDAIVEKLPEKNKQKYEVSKTPLLASGSKFKFDLNDDDPMWESDLSYLPQGTIIFSMETEYENHCAHITRTFFIDPHDMQYMVYIIIQEAQQAAIRALKRGKKANDAHIASLKVVEKLCPEMIPNCPTNVGKGTADPHNAPEIILDATNETRLEIGMVFCVTFGLSGLDAYATENLSLPIFQWVSDTVLITKEGPNVVTACCLKDFHELTYAFSNEFAKEEIKETVNTVIDNTLILEEEASITLSQLCIRPTFGGRDSCLRGKLTAHLNGLRFSTSKEDKSVDILFQNIKRSFFKLGRKEIVLHFYVGTPTVVGNKSTYDVQFYYNRLGPLKGSNASKHLQKKTDVEIFIEQVDALWKREGIPMKFQQHEEGLLGFHGKYKNESASILTTNDCFVKIDREPFFVIELKEIETVNTEQVQHNQKITAEITIVLKDFTREAYLIDSILPSSLHGLQEWVEARHARFYKLKKPEHPPSEEEDEDEDDEESDVPEIKSRKINEKRKLGRKERASWRKHFIEKSFR